MVAPKFVKTATPVGFFWRAETNPSTVRAFLQKQAGIGGETEGGFEQAFSSLGYAYLKDSAPRLLDYMVGFQLVDRNNDSTKAIGVFGFYVSGQWLYVPIFFLNGDLKGHELLYLKSQDVFVPLKENWVNYVLAMRPHSLGEPSEQETYQLGGMMPDIRTLAISPMLAKRAAELRIPRWAAPALPMLAALQTKTARFLYNTAAEKVKLAFDAVVETPLQAALAETSGRLSLDGLLSDNFACLKTAFDTAQRYPAIKQGFDRFYGHDCFSRWAAALRQDVSRQQLNLLPQKQASVSMSLFPADAELHPVKSGELKVYEHATITTNLPELTTSEREKLLRDGVLIQDKRDSHGPNTSVAYNTQLTQTLTNPQESGLYDILEKPGEVSRMLVVYHPVSGSGEQSFCTVVRLGSPKAWMNAHATKLWGTKIESREDFDKWFESLEDGKTLQEHATYIAIGPDGSGTTPFRVNERFADGLHRVTFEARCDYDFHRDRNMGNIDERSGHGSNYDVLLHTGDENKNTKLRLVKDELRVPPSYRLLKLKSPPEPRGDSPCCESSCRDSASEPLPIQPGRLDDVQMFFMRKTARLKLACDGCDTIITTGWKGAQRLSPLAALASLVQDHGLTEKAARDLLKTATVKKVATFRIAYAPGFGGQPLVKQAFPNVSSLDGGPSAPPPPPQQIGMEQVGRTAMRAVYPEEYQVGVPSLDSSRGDQQHRNMWERYRYEDFQKQLGNAQQASQSGQKEVFDTSMLSGLLKAVRQDTLIDRYLGDLFKALDKLGRLLLLFYWHGEEFEDRYGHAEMPEMEDALRNSFESLGEIVLELKKKTISPSFEADDPGNAPDVEATARI